MATYAGRALYFLDTLGDLTTLLTTQTELDASQKLLERHAAGDAHGASDGELWLRHFSGRWPAAHALMIGSSGTDTVAATQALMQTCDTQPQTKVG